MKRILFLTAVLICILNFTAAAQTNKKQVTPPSDAPSGFTYDFDKTNELIIDRLSNPTVANEDVKVLIDEPSFPIRAKGQTIDQDYKKKIAIWVETHPSLVINALKNRKDVVRPF